MCLMELLSDSVFYVSYHLFCVEIDLFFPIQGNGWFCAHANGFYMCATSYTSGKQDMVTASNNSSWELRANENFFQKLNFLVLLIICYLYFERSILIIKISLNHIFNYNSHFYCMNGNWIMFFFFFWSVPIKLVSTVCKVPSVSTFIHSSIILVKINCAFGFKVVSWLACCIVVQYIRQLPKGLELISEVRSSL